MKKRHYLTDEDIHRIQHMIEVDKLQQWKVAEALGICTATVEKVCKNLRLCTQRTGPRNGSGHTNWKGGKNLVGQYWYIYCPNHPHATKKGTVAEHRLVMEEKLGRYLAPSEVVHHIDGNPQNNLPENLMVFPTNSRHLREELKGRVPEWTPSGLEKMREGIQRRANLYRIKPDGSQRRLKKYHRKKKSDSIDEDRPS